jgi:hypothetical protein
MFQSLDAIDVHDDGSVEGKKGGVRLDSRAYFRIDFKQFTVQVKLYDL